MIEKCQICQGDFKEFIDATDKMFNTSDKFIYGLCGKCGCLQELNPPEDMQNHYPKNYYSLIQKSNKSLKNWRKGIKRKIILTHPQIISKFIKFVLPGNELYWAYRDCGLDIHKKFLDVGTGAGEHVTELRQAGLKNAMGIDPHIEGDIYNEKTLLVRKCHIESVNEKFDFITFHHSLEHIPDQIRTINAASEILNDEGRILIRVPTVSSMAFEKYKSNWFQLDAPRHLFLHSHESIRLLAQLTGMKISKLWCDSNEHQFLISEIYSKKQKVNLDHSEIKKAIKETFNSSQLTEFKELTKTANKSRKGDQICVLLEKI